MTRSSADRPYLTVDFATSAKTRSRPREDRVKVRRVRIIEEVGRHTLAVVRLGNDLGARYDHFDSGTGIEILWGWGTNEVASFYGYISHSRPVKQEGVRASTDVYCVGPTFPLKQRRVRLYEDRTIPEVAARICRRAHLSLLTEQHPRIDTYLQNGETDWRFLSNLAQRLGWLLVSNGSEVIMLPRDRMAALTKPVAPRLRLGGSLYKVKPTVGANRPSGGRRARREAYGIDRAGKLVSRIDDGKVKGLGKRSEAPLFTEFYDGAVSSEADAHRALRAAAESNRWAYMAEASARGVARLGAGDLVAIDDAGADANGLWFTDRIEHIVNQERYDMRLRLGREGVGDTGERPSSGRPPVSRKRAQKAPKFVPSQGWRSRASVTYA